MQNIATEEAWKELSSSFNWRAIIEKKLGSVPGDSLFASFLL